jgi:hypothetical protein
MTHDNLEDLLNSSQLSNEASTELETVTDNLSDQLDEALEVGASDHLDNLTPVTPTQGDVLINQSVLDSGSVNINVTNPDDSIDTFQQFGADDFVENNLVDSAIINLINDFENPIQVELDGQLVTLQELQTSHVSAEKEIVTVVETLPDGTEIIVEIYNDIATSEKTIPASVLQMLEKIVNGTFIPINNTITEQDFRDCGIFLPSPPPIECIATSVPPDVVQPPVAIATYIPDYCGFILAAKGSNKENTQVKSTPNISDFDSTSFFPQCKNYIYTCTSDMIIRNYNSNCTETKPVCENSYCVVHCFEDPPTYDPTAGIEDDQITKLTINFDDLVICRDCNLGNGVDTKGTILELINPAPGATWQGVSSIDGEAVTSIIQFNNGTNTYDLSITCQYFDGVSNQTKIVWAGSKGGNNPIGHYVLDSDSVDANFNIGLLRVGA